MGFFFLVRFRDKIFFNQQSHDYLEILQRLSFLSRISKELSVVGNPIFLVPQTL